MKPPPFQYHDPKTIAEAVALLGRLDNAKLLAGGQSLMPMLNMRFVLPDHVIDLNRVEGLAAIKEANGALEIGAMTRQRDIEYSDLVKAKCPLLHQAIMHIGHRQTRNRGTIGGSLCHLDPAAELVSVAAAHDATVVAAGPNGPREIAFADFPVAFMTPSIELNEMVVAVRLPLWAAGHKAAFVEFSRRHGDFAIVSAAVMLEINGGKIGRASVTIGGVAVAPYRAREVEQAITGQAASSDLFRKACESCRAIEAIEDVHASSSYRQHLAAVLSRRDLLTLLGGATAAAGALPFGASAQQAMPVVGFLDSEAINPTAVRIKAFRQGLAEAGYVEGRNVTIEYRSIEGQYDRLPELAAELIRRKVTVIAVTAGLPGAKAVQSATAITPIVFRLGSDPVASGLVASLNRPGGNVTGVTTLGEELVPKRLEVLHELVPRVTTIAFLVNPANPNPETQSRMQALARTLGLQLHVLHASTERDVDAIFARAAELRAGGLVIGGDAFFRSAVRSTQLATLAMRHKIPAISFVREFTAAGGLMTYEGSLADSYRTFGISTGRILKGDKPAELPVIQSTRVELIINLKSAKALGISVPLSLLGRADEIIE